MLSPHSLGRVTQHTAHQPLLPICRHCSQQRPQRETRWQEHSGTSKALKVVGMANHKLLTSTNVGLESGKDT